MAEKQQINLFWFRRDLRLHDNHGLYQALQSKLPVLPIFIFDKHILDKLKDPKDARVSFLHRTLQGMQKKLDNRSSGIKVCYGKPEEVFEKLFKSNDFEINTVYINRDYEPYAIEREKKIWKLLSDNGIDFKGYKDHVIFEKSEIMTGENKPYSVFTPYSKKWKSELGELPHYASEDALDNLLKWEVEEMPKLTDMGFEESELPIPSADIADETLKNYKNNRNFPAKTKGTSRIGIHLRHGTLSIRSVAKLALEKSDSFLNELIWRDFYQMILHHNPQVLDKAFREKYDAIPWRRDQADFQKWCEGKTGYPIVDAGMRELNQTGYMHNRVRMITASFLTKHLLIDWRWGEAYFGEKLLDYELASNNGGWQWAAGSGADAAPYFRVFNPQLQMDKFDKNGDYVKKFVPEFGTDKYPKPMVEHKFARERALETFKTALK